MTNQNFITNGAESPEMTAASTAYFAELGSAEAYVNDCVANTIANICANTPIVKQALTSGQTMVVFENNRDGTLKTDRIGNPTAKLTALGRKLFALQQMPLQSQFRQFTQGYEFHPNWKSLFRLIDDPIFRNCRENELGMSLRDGRLVGQYLNEKLAEARREGRKKALVKEVHDWAKQIGNRAKKAEAYLSEVLDSRDQLMISRLEVGCLAGSERFTRPDILVQDFERVVTKAKGERIFKDLVGYAWRLCRTTTEGFRIHVVLFHDAVNMLVSSDPARDFGEFWSTNSDLRKNWQQYQSPYKNLGTRIVSKNEPRDCITQGLGRFLVRNDEFFRPQMPDGMSDVQMFGFGETPLPQEVGQVTSTQFARWQDCKWRRC